MNNKISIIGIESGLGAQNQLTKDGPRFLKDNFHKIQKELLKNGFDIEWEEIIKLEDFFNNDTEFLTFSQKEDLISKVCLSSKAKVINLINNNKFPIVIGGDHSLATGTWSGVAEAFNCHKNLGLIWFDAHMDSHTSHTSMSKAIHGMPLALLMGHGSSNMLETIFTNKEVLSPEHVVLIGIRSYEEGEEALLRKLGVKIYYIDEVNEKGLNNVFKEAISYLEKRTDKIGISLDIDAFDPIHAPGTASVEHNGLVPKDFFKALKNLSSINQIVALEIMEYNPHLDQELKTFKLIDKIINNFLINLFQKPKYAVRP